MSSRGAVLLAIGMLVLGLLLGMVSGGVAGFYIGQGQRPFLGQNLPRLQQIPDIPQLPRNVLPSVPSISAGVRVIEVEKDGAAAKAGLQPGDIITAVDSTKIDDTHPLGDLIQARKPGDKISLAVTRGALKLTVSVELGPAPQDSTTAYLGIRFAPIIGPIRRRSLVPNPVTPTPIPNG